MIKQKFIAGWFTLVEITIVIIIVGILLSSVVFLGFAYINSVQIKTIKQWFTWQYNTFTAIARTSNYLQTDEYDDMTITLYEESIAGEVALSVWWNRSLQSYLMDDAILSFTWSDSWGRIEVDITPYQIGCDRIWISSLGTTVTGVELQMVSSINNDVYCFSIDQSTCKLLENPCL